MADFNKAIEVVLNHEGGYKPATLDDPGGETNWGLTKRSYPNLDIKNLTKEKAIEIYKQDWWDKYQLSAITSADLATKILDLLVNMGPQGGTEVIQNALNGKGVVTKVDGVFGLQTLANCNKVNADALIQELKAQAAVKYARIIIKKPDEQEEIFVVNLLGWMRRAVS